MYDAKGAKPTTSTAAVEVAGTVRVEISAAIGGRTRRRAF
jgi:hypothetical protein